MLKQITFVIVYAVAAAIVPGSQFAQAQETSLASLIEQLNSDKPGTRLDAATDIAAMGPFARKAVPALSKNLDPSNLPLAYECLIALGNIGPLAGSATEDVAAIAEKAGPLQATALDALRKMGQAAQIDLNAVQKLVSSENDAVAVAAARCLGAIEERPDNNDLPARLVRALSSDRSSVRNAATAGLVEFGAQSVSALSKAVRSEDSRVQMSACLAASRIGATAVELTPDLLELLKTDNKVLLRQAIRALGRLAGDAADVLPAVKPFLKSESAALRAFALDALAEYGDAAADSVPAVIGMLNNDDSVIVRVAAASALGRIGAGQPEAATALVRAIKDAHGGVTIRAANSLAQIGSVAVEPLTGLIADPDFSLLALNLLAEMGSEGKPAIDAILKVLDDEDAEKRRAAFVSLAAMGPDAASAVPTLRAILKDPERGDSRAAAAYVLGKIGDPESIALLKEVVSGSHEDDSKLPLAAVWALVTLDPGDPAVRKAAPPVLASALDSDDPLVRREAAAAIALLGGAAEVAVPGLLKLAREDADATVQAECLHSLATLEVKSADALDVAIAALESNVSEVRNSATFLLGTMGADAAGSASALRANTRHGEELDRMVAAWALYRVAPTEEHGRVALPLMLTALEQPNPRARVAAAKTLGMIGTATPAVTRALKQAASSDNEEVSAAARKALSELH